ncbi:SPC12-domain-containing protein [Ascodesmis nigricans]|uniref:Signal peptidase complex subunit 1 n=1 Tax=Ascodesmis nigricans TaxID=341454 RepID=A0A4S2N465_9PEZI|nr:SPC12-domain-containing protein [Ascodesmis nigricans]
MGTIQRFVDSFIDFEDQKLAEQLCNILLILMGLIAYAIGFTFQDLRYIVYISLGGTALTMLAVVPPWPFFNKHPVSCFLLEQRRWRTKSNSDAGHGLGRKSWVQAFSNFSFKDNVNAD